jgi:hypothetical protein
MHELISEGGQSSSQVLENLGTLSPEINAEKKSRINESQ